MGKFIRKLLAITLCVSFVGGECVPYQGIHAEGLEHTKYIGKGSYSTITKGKQVYSEEAGLVDRTTEQAWWPKRTVAGNVYITENMKGAIPTNDWATSFLWGTMYGGVNNPFSQPAYAYPLAYQASSEGMYVTLPPEHTVMQQSGAMDYAMPLQTGYIDLAVKPTAFTPKDAKVDKVTDWSYDVVMESGNHSMMTTMVQGSPFAYFQCENTDLSIQFKRGTRMLLEKGNATSQMIVVKVLDNKEEDWNYYAFFGPEGVKWNIIYQDGTSIKEIQVQFPNNESYMSMAALPTESSQYAEYFKKYAYNFITDTKVSWRNDENTGEVITDYKIVTEKKKESTGNGTIIGLLPHQWKHDEESDFLNVSYRTVRGNMKLITGDSFETKLKFSGILPFMPQIAGEDKEQLRVYLNDYMNKYKDNSIPYLEIFEGTGDTYWIGKALNNLSNVLAVAEQLGETEKANILLQALKGVLEDWFSTDDREQDNYFYYDKEVGTLVGYPSNFGSDTQLNDHHFHYGYWINAAAQVALRDPEWAKDKNWGGMVKELIGDIACSDRSGERYPFLRNFAPYEGHSWASGHQLFLDGNNQESSSEAIHAWAGIILFGEAVGDESLRDLGIYLYTTEVSAIENYWFDLDKDVLSPKFRYKDQSATSYDSKREEIQTQASMIWGGKYVYGTWWSAEPLQVQGINLLPITGASLYLAKDKQYIKQNYLSARKLENQYHGSDKLSNPYDRWNDIWHEYLAMSDPDSALSSWSRTADEEGGESRAHTYHFMKTMDHYGTPNLEVTGDEKLSAVFEKNGVRSYCAFNPSDQAKRITFSDSAWIEVAPHSIYIGKNGTNNVGNAGIVVTKQPTEKPTITPSNRPTATPSIVPSVTPTITVTSSEIPKPTTVVGETVSIFPYSTLEMIGPDTAKITFSKDALWVDIHYIEGSQGQQFNYRMQKENGKWYLLIPNLKEHGTLTIGFTYFDNVLGYAVDSEMKKVEYVYQASSTVKPSPSNTPVSTKTAIPSVTPVPTKTAAPSVTPVPMKTPTKKPSPSVSPQNTEVKPYVTVQTRKSGSISQNYSIQSLGSKPVDLSKLTIRYYYKTSSTGSRSQSFWCDNAGLQLSSAPYYVNLANDVKGQFGTDYLEIKFDTNQAIRTKEGTLNLGVRFANSDWSSYQSFEEIGVKVYYDGKEVEM